MSPAHRVLPVIIPVVLACALGASAATAATAATAAQASALARPKAALVADIAPGAASSDPQDLTAMNGELFFSAWDPAHGRQLWESGGTAAGTVRLTDVPGGADPTGLAVADGGLFFSARDPAHGRELWKSDGTAAGTTLVSDLVPGPAGSDPRDITYAIGQQDNTTPAQVLVYFSAWDPADGRQLWQSDGTAAGTVMISDVNPGPVGLNPADISALTGTTAMFSGDDGTHGREPWVTDGTTAGTQMYADLNPGAAGSDPVNITAATYNIGIFFPLTLWYFSADDGTHGREFFAAYPGSPPADVYDINPGPASSDPGPFVSVVSGTGLAAATSATDGRELFQFLQPPLPPVVVGPQPGTATQVTGVGPGAGSDPVLGPTSFIGEQNAITTQTRNYFSGDDGTHGRQLWQADELVFRGPGEGGSVSFSIPGVRLVADIGAGSSDPAGFASFGGTSDNGATEVFSARDGAHGRELWISDGWSANTALAADIDPGPGSSDPADITVIGQTAYFTAYAPGRGRELWKLTVPPTPPLYLNGPITPVATGSSNTFVATLQPVAGDPTPSGSVTFYQDGTEISRVPLTPQASGASTASVTLTAPSGTESIVAVYHGDDTYTPATSGTVQLTGS
jgi:ELWxxDGT repeat protein